MRSFLHHLREAVGDGQGGVDEPLHAAHQTRLRPVVQLRARSVHALVPAHVREAVHLRLELRLLLLDLDHPLQLCGLCFFRRAQIVKVIHFRVTRGF